MTLQEAQKKFLELEESEIRNILFETFPEDPEKQITQIGQIRHIPEASCITADVTFRDPEDGTKVKETLALRCPSLYDDGITFVHTGYHPEGELFYDRYIDALELRGIDPDYPGGLDEDMVREIFEDNIDDRRSEDEIKNCIQNTLFGQILYAMTISPEDFDEDDRQFLEGHGISANTASGLDSIACSLQDCSKDKNEVVDLYKCRSTIAQGALLEFINLLAESEDAIEILTALDSEVDWLAAAQEEKPGIEVVK